MFDSPEFEKPTAIREAHLRKLDFWGGLPIRLGDGQEWAFVGPRELPEIGETSRIEVVTLLLEIADAEDESDRLRGELAWQSTCSHSTTTCPRAIYGVSSPKFTRKQITPTCRPGSATWHVVMPRRSGGPPRRPREIKVVVTGFLASVIPTGPRRRSPTLSERADRGRIIRISDAVRP